MRLLTDGHLYEGGQFAFRYRHQSPLVVFGVDNLSSIAPGTLLVGEEDLRHTTLVRVVLKEVAAANRTYLASVVDNLYCPVSLFAHLSLSPRSRDIPKDT